MPQRQVFSAVEKKKILVIGGGFGGVFAAKELARRGRSKFDIELINNNNYFVFQPLLPEVAAATIHSSDAVAPLRLLLRHTQIRQAYVMGIDFDKKTVTVVQGFRRVPVDLPYDELIIALGMSVDLNRFPGLPEHALTMKNISDAHRLRTHVISCLEMADVATEPDLKRELLTFVVVGAGFTGVETVAEVNDLIHRALKYYPNVKPEEIRVYLIEYADRILPTFPADLAEYATQRLRMHGIEVKTGIGTKSATSTGVELADGSIIPTRTIVATIGNGPHRLVESLNLDMQWGRIKTDRFMRVAEHDGVWAAGDAALIPLVEQPSDEPLDYAPQTAQFAVREGRQLADNLIAKVEATELKPFAYTSKGSLASLGMSKAVAEVYGIKLSGTLAWLLWRGFYLSFLPGIYHQGARAGELDPERVRAAQYRARAILDARHALYPLPQGRQGARARHADRRLLYRGQRHAQAHHRQSRHRRAFRARVRAWRAFWRACAGSLIAPHRTRRGARELGGVMDLAARLHAARARLPVHGDVLQELYREDLRRPGQGVRARQRRAPRRA